MNEIPGKDKQVWTNEVFKHDINNTDRTCNQREHV